MNDPGGPSTKEVPLSELEEDRRDEIEKMAGDDAVASETEQEDAEAPSVTDAFRGGS